MERGERRGVERAVCTGNDVQGANQERQAAEINGTNALASRLLALALPGERERGQGEVILLEWGGCGWRAV